jgi:hypothetical protein
MPEKTNTAGGPRVELAELIALIRAYVLQETVGPLKRIGRTLGLGLGAAVMIGVGAVLGLVGLLRLLQGETGTVFAGEWSWVPYALTLISAIAFLGVAAAVGLRSPRSGSETP